MMYTKMYTKISPGNGVTTSVLEKLVYKVIPKLYHLIPF